MEQNLHVQPVIRQALNFFAPVPSSAGGSLLQMPAVNSGADAKESDVPACERCGFDLLGGCKCPEEGYCNAHGDLDCLRCAREEKYRMYEEERGAIAAEEAQGL